MDAVMAISPDPPPSAACSAGVDGPAEAAAERFGARLTPSPA
ncbi:MAG TPA: hypothetical protein VFV66_32560 [Nonomuraea sp.]|nr:hypothetical protein [Nonomuraea sp.]